MLVAELIKILRIFPSDALVVFSQESHGSYPDSEHEIEAEGIKYREYDNVLDLNER